MSEHCCTNWFIFNCTYGMGNSYSWKGIRQFLWLFTKQKASKNRANTSCKNEQAFFKVRWRQALSDKRNGWNAYGKTALPRFELGVCVHCVLSSPQILRGASNSKRMGWLRKISRDLRHSPRISLSVSCTFLPGREPLTARRNVDQDEEGHVNAQKARTPPTHKTLPKQKNSWAELTVWQVCHPQQTR